MVAPNVAESQLADLMPSLHTDGESQESQWEEQRVWTLELADYLGCDPHEVNRTARALMRRKLPFMKLEGQKVAYVTATVAAQVILRVRVRQGERCESAPTEPT